MNEVQKRRLAEAGYPGHDLPAKSQAVHRKATTGRCAEAVKKHIELRKGQ